MPCYRLNVGEAAAIVCTTGRSSGKKWFVKGCGRKTNILCDHELGDGKTCDRPICDRHGKEIGPNKDLCLEHWVIWKRTAPPETAGGQVKENA